MLNLVFCVRNRRFLMNDNFIIKTSPENPCTPVEKTVFYCINIKIFPPVNFTEIFANFIMWLIGIIVKNTSETVIFCQNEPRKQFTCAPVERTVTFTADSLPGSPCFDGRALLLFNGRAYSCLLIFTGSL